MNFDILWPSVDMSEKWKREEPADLNDTSIVTRVEFTSGENSFCAYFTGDIPKEILERIISKQCKILKISHHGSKTGTNQEVLDQARPDIAIIELGKNSYGHPHKEVLDLLKSKSIEVYRTDTDGQVEITFDHGNFKIRRAN